MGDAWAGPMGYRRLCIGDIPEGDRGLAFSVARGWKKRDVEKSRRDFSRLTFPLFKLRGVSG